MGIARGRAGEFGEAATRNAPVGDHRHVPTHALARLHHLRAGGCVGDENQYVGAGILVARQLRDHVDVAVLEFFDTDDLDAVNGHFRRLQSFLVGFSPRIVDQHQARLFGAESLLSVLQQLDIDDGVDRRDPEHVVRVRIVAGDRRGRRPIAHERHLRLIGQRHDGQRHRRIDAAEEGRNLLLEDQFARRDDSLRWARFVVAADEFDLAAAENAARRVDLVHCDREPTCDRLAGLRGRTRQRRDQSELNRFGSLGAAHDEG